MVEQNFYNRRLSLHLMSLPEEEKEKRRKKSVITSRVTKVIFRIISCMISATYIYYKFTETQYKKQRVSSEQGIL
jgi:hypothetical protein